MYLQGELRLAKIMEPDAESNAPAGVPIPWWHHVECFIENRESLGVESSITAESFTGFSNLKKEDKDLLKSKLGSGRGKKGKGDKRKAPSVDETDAKRTKTVTAEEDEIQKQLKVCLELLVTVQSGWDSYVYVWGFFLAAEAQGIFPIFSWLHPPKHNNDSSRQLIPPATCTLYAGYNL